MLAPTSTPSHPPAQGAIDPRLLRLLWACVAAGVVFGVAGAITDVKQFAYSYLLAFMFYLGLVLGSLFLVLVHHLFDAAWSVPIRRIPEHLAFLSPVMAALFIPIAILAKPAIYTWMRMDPRLDHALAAKQPLFTLAGFYVVAVVLFASWSWLTYNLRKWSLKQDETGAAECTYKLRKYSAGGIYLFAFTLTLAAIMWMMSLELEWYSTMYGVYYYAASVWVAIGAVYLITVWLRRAGPLSGVVHTRQVHDLGVLLLAFTVFYAYIHFAQYLLIWNAALPEETFWYVQREFGSWWQIGLLLVFGHFLLPFLALLRIDTKLTLPVMVPLCLWVLAMHFIDMSFNIMPVIHPNGFWLDWRDIACLVFMGGVLSLVFLKYFTSHPAYPQKDPRMGEALGVHHAGVRAPIAMAD